MTDTMQTWRADGLAAAASIALYELERDGQIAAHTRELLASALAAYEAGKNEPPSTTPEAVDRQMDNATQMIRRVKRLAGEE